MEKDCYPSFTGCIGNDPCLFTSLKNAYLKLDECSCSDANPRVKLTDKSSKYFLELLFSSVFWWKRFSGFAATNRSQYAFACLKSFGMGQKRDSNPFYGPKWEWTDFSFLFFFFLPSQILFLSMKSSFHCAVDEDDVGQTDETQADLRRLRDAAWWLTPSNRWALSLRRKV